MLKAVALRAAFGHRFFVSLLFIVSAPLACQRAPSATRAQPSASARVADPKAYPRERLVQALATVAARWQGLGVLPSCDAELAKADERERCVAAQKALAARKEAATAASTNDSTRLDLSAQAALSSQRASEALRASGVNRLLEARPKPSASAAPAAKPPTSAARAKVLPSNSAFSSKSVPTREQSDPYLDSIQAYARVATVALAELRAYLEFADASLRAAALSRVESLAGEQPHWAALAALVNEAYLVESDPVLKQRLSALRSRLGI